MKWIKRWIKKIQPLTMKKKQRLEPAREGFRDEQWQGWTPLMMAVVQNNEDIVKDCLKTAVDLNAVEHQQGNTALMLALKEKQWSHALLLIEAGADVNRSNKKGQTPLMLTVTNGSKEQVEAVLSKGANLHEVDDEGWSPLMMAVSRGDLDLVKTLLKHGARINHHSRKKPMALMHSKTLAMMELLIQQGACVNVKNKNGDSFLMQCIEKGESVDMIKVLLKHHARVHAVNAQGETPLLLAVKTGQWEVVKALLSMKLYPEEDIIGLKNGKSVLMCACFQRNETLIKELLNAGANPHLKNEFGTSALDDAKRQGLDNIVDLIESMELSKKMNQVVQGSQHPPGPGSRSSRGVLRL